MTGKIIVEGSGLEPEQIDYNNINYVDEVSTKEVKTYGAGEDKKKVVLVDCGAKNNILRCLLNRAWR